MLAKTHLIGGAGAAAIYLTAVSNGDFCAPDLNFIQMAASVPLCLLGSVFPDIDIKGSFFEKATGTLICSTGKIYGHRTFFHSLLLMIMLLSIGNTYFPTHIWVVIPINIGIWSHINLDMMNPAGVVLFWPIPIRISIMKIETGTRGERIFAYGLSIIVIFMWAQFIFSFF